MQADARMPVQGDSIRITVIDGITYYGTVQGLDQGLLCISCNAVSEEKPLLYEPKNLVGGKDLGYHAPYIEKIAPTDLCIGIGSIIELAWM